jgi:hypothetical protein
MTFVKLNTNQNVKITEAIETPLERLIKKVKENLFFLKNLQEDSMTIANGLAIFTNCFNSQILFVKINATNLCCSIY